MSLFFSFFLPFPSSPLSFKDITDLGMSCMADYGAPVFPFLAVGGYQSEWLTFFDDCECDEHKKISFQHSSLF